MPNVTEGLCVRVCGDELQTWLIEWEKKKNLHIIVRVFIIQAVTAEPND